jgi:predicted dithiol-disulfide oxidoreductase (DUF899 family)
MQQRIVSREDWLAERKWLLAKEKELTKARDQLSAARRGLPWVKVDKPYVFDGANGPRSLSDLFDGRSQLIVYHFMLGPGWVQGCPSCSYLADHFGGALPHLAQRDVSFTAVSRAPYVEIAAYKKRMGWDFGWVSSHRNDFNRDFHVSFTADELKNNKAYYNYAMGTFGAEEAPGLSVFARNDKGEVFHTYSTYARGIDILAGAYTMLDFVPKGRDEAGLPWPMAWVRRHDEYEPAPQPKAAACCCG